MNKKLVLKTLYLALLSTALLPYPESFASSSLQQLEREKPPTLRILLAKGPANGDAHHWIEVKGRYTLYNLSDGDLILSATKSPLQPVHITAEGLYFGELMPGIHQMRIAPGDSRSTILVDGIEYRGWIDLYSVDGKLAIVNEVDVENFLRATIAPQFASRSSESREVLEALAIVARTHACAHLKQHRGSVWHLTAADAGYQGSSLGQDAIGMLRAIDETRHLVMTYEGNPFAATWTEECAGRTASFATLFRKESAGPTGVQLPQVWLSSAPSTWSFSLSKRALAELLDLSEVSEFNLYLDSASSKVYGIRASDGHRSIDLDFFSFQQVVGANRLLSSDFTTRVEKETIHFNGLGRGHGVGLCLTTAKKMAEQRANAETILATFFPGTTLTQLKKL